MKFINVPSVCCPECGEWGAVVEVGNETPIHLFSCGHKLKLNPDLMTSSAEEQYFAAKIIDGEIGTIQEYPGDDEMKRRIKADAEAEAAQEKADLEAAKVAESEGPAKSRF